MFPFYRNLKTFSISLLALSLFACGGEEETSAAKSEKKMEKAAVPAMETAAPVKEMESTPAEEEYVVTAPPLETSTLVPEPRPELKHDVVTQDEIYKNWPYQEEALKAEPTMEDQAMDKAKEAMNSMSSEMEEKVVNKLAEVTGQSNEDVANVVAMAKEVAGKAPAATGGAEHTVNSKGLTAFDRPIIYIAPGDTVHFKKMAGGHNSESVFSPEGGETWKGAMNKNISVTLTVPGIYGYLCLPHAGLGMNGVIVVGDAGDKEKVMEYLRGLPQTDFARKLLGKVNKVKAENYIK